MQAGSDAESERDVTVTVQLQSSSRSTQRVLWRRELLGYAVEGPDGPFDCPASPLGTPQRDAYTTLPPKAHRRLVTRLIEATICRS